MNKTISIIRIIVLLALSATAFLFLFGEEQDENLSVWTLHFIFDKAFAVGVGYLTCVLYCRWRKVDQWIAAYDKLSSYDEEDDAPNPMHSGKED